MNWHRLSRLDNHLEALMAWLAPAVLLMARLWVAQVFFRAGWLKLESWSSTLYLFQEEYHVPLLSPSIAAWLGTGIELIVPLFLVVGLFTRPAALFLFLYNAMAVISYPALWNTGFYDHQLWGALLLMNAIWGGGFVSMDRLLKVFAERGWKGRTVPS